MNNASIPVILKNEESFLEVIMEKVKSEKTFKQSYHIVSEETIRKLEKCADMRTNISPEIIEYKWIISRNLAIRLKREENEKWSKLILLKNEDKIEYNASDVNQNAKEIVYSLVEQK